MRKTTLFLLFSFFCVFMHSQNFSLVKTPKEVYGYDFNPYSGIEDMSLYENNEALFKFESFMEKEDVKLKYEITTIDKMPFIIFSDNLPKEIYELDDGGDTNNKMLFLAGKLPENGRIIIFSFIKGFPFKDGSFTSSYAGEIRPIFYDCSSFLKERNKEYPIENLDDERPDTPWVENAPGYGIGENFKIRQLLGRPFLLIMNGYISYDKPYLYKQNGRIKKLRISGIKSKKEKIVEVLDTPHPQTVDISFLEDEDAQITIEEVYPGTKYEDTCIHFMYPSRYEVIPYINSY